MVQIAGSGPARKSAGRYSRTNRRCARNTSGQIRKERSAMLAPKDIRAPIDAEYAFLCDRLGLMPVPLDVFYPDPTAPMKQLTPLGSEVKIADARYGGTPRILVLPIGDGDEAPTLMPPPTTWDRFDPQWPTWRLELWHEVIHQHSDQIGHAWDPKEPAIIRPDGRRTYQGHGAGWWAALTAVATAFTVDPTMLSTLVDI